MKISVMTYNVLFNKAIPHLADVLNTYKPDVVCFQEIETNEQTFKNIEAAGYQLADYSNSFIKFNKIYGLATFFRKETGLQCVESQTLYLPRSYYEILLFILRGGNSPRTVLRTEFRLDGKSFSMYNVHLTARATNTARSKQIKETLQDLKIRQKDHVIIAGDFNYPYGRKKFEEMIADHGLHEATNTLFFTSDQKFFGVFSFRLKLDYILYKDLRLKETKMVDVSYSDHYPIMSYFEI